MPLRVKIKSKETVEQQLKRLDKTLKEVSGKVNKMEKQQRGG